MTKAAGKGSTPRVPTLPTPTVPTHPMPSVPTPHMPLGMAILWCRSCGIELVEASEGQSVKSKCEHEEKHKIGWIETKYENNEGGNDSTTTDSDIRPVTKALTDDSQ
jgi:hypothetical protein